MIRTSFLDREDLCSLSNMCLEDMGDSLVGYWKINDSLVSIKYAVFHDYFKGYEEFVSAKSENRILLNKFWNNNLKIFITSSIVGRTCTN